MFLEHQENASIMLLVLVEKYTLEYLGQLYILTSFPGLRQLLV